MQEPDKDKYKGIACPNPACQAVGKYKGGQGTKSQDCWTRKKECKVCGTIFTTIEVPVGIVEIKNNHIPPVTPV